MQVCDGPAYSEVEGFVLSGPGPGDHHELGARETLLACGHRSPHIGFSDFGEAPGHTVRAFVIDMP